MHKKTFSLLDQAPMFWVAVGMGFLLFATNQVLPGINWEAASSEQSVLDQAFVHSLRSQEWTYEVVPDTPQTYGAHVLTHYLKAGVSKITGDSGRAGIWLSLFGLIATLCGMYPLSLRIFPHRGFSVITLAATGALGALHFSFSPDPSAALGMALVVWGMALFLTAVTKRHPYDVFASGLLFGLAGYIRIELSVIWLFLALYLVCLSIFQSAKNKDDASYIPMALGGLFTVMLVLWPMMHRNISLALSPILPGFDAKTVLGAPAVMGPSNAEPFFSRLLQGIKLLMLSHRGPGIFAGLLWPLGMGICLFMGRHKKLPYFWFPIIVGTLLTLTALSYVTGLQSFRESLLILTPLLFPFAILPAAFALHQWMQSDFKSDHQCRLLWAVTGVGLYLMVQLPHFLRSGTSGNVENEKKRTTLIREFGNLPASEQNAMLLSDMPGSFLTAGKPNVIGIHGETDWKIISAKYANGDFQLDKLLSYLRENKIRVIHLSDVEDPLVEKLQQMPDAPAFVRINAFSPPHRVFRVDWL